MEYLGISLDVAALHEYNKKELLNRLVRRSGSILGIKTMALICMTFSIDDVKVWEFIVNNAVAFSLVSNVVNDVHLSAREFLVCRIKNLPQFLKKR